MSDVRDRAWSVFDWIMVLVLLGALVSTGFFLFFGRVTREIPRGFADIYIGWTGNKCLGQDAKIFGFDVVNDEGYLFGIKNDGWKTPICLTPSEGAQRLLGEKGGITYSATTPPPGGTEPPSGQTETPSPGPGETSTPVPPSQAQVWCAGAIARIKALEGTTDPAPIKEAALTAIANCTAPGDVAIANAALAAAEKELVQEEQRKQFIATWNSIQASLASNPRPSPKDVEFIITVLGGGKFELKSIAGLWPGVLNNYVGGGEEITIIIYPPENLSADLTYIEVHTTLDFMFGLGFGKPSDGLKAGEVPALGVYDISKSPPITPTP